MESNQRLSAMVPGRIIRLFMRRHTEIALILNICSPPPIFPISGPGEGVMEGQVRIRTVPSWSKVLELMNTTHFARIEITALSA
jgi:hypothetical protein